MKQLTCEKCGSTDFEKQDDLLICKTCGYKYSVEEGLTEDTDFVKTEDLPKNSNCFANVDSLLKRAYIFLEDGLWEKTNEYAERILDIDPENVKAYEAMLLADLKIKTEDDLVNSNKAFSQNEYYKKALQFSDEKQKQILLNINQENIYRRAIKTYRAANSEYDYKTTKNLFETIKGYKDSEEYIKKCNDKSESARIESVKKKAITRKKMAIAISSIAGVIIIAIVIFAFFNISSNNKKADEIYENFANETFIYLDRSGDSIYMDGELYEWSLVSKYLYTFGKDGKVKYEYTFEQRYSSAWIESDPTSENSKEEKEEIYDSYIVKVGFWGKITLKVGGLTFSVEVNKKNEPIFIKDFMGRQYY